MMLLGLIKARLDILVDNKYFPAPDGRVRAIPQVFLGATPAKRNDPQNPEDFPFFVLRPLIGGLGFDLEVTIIQVIGGLYAPDGVLEALDLIGQYNTIMLAMVKQGVGFGDWALLPSQDGEYIQAQYGDKDGLQDDPYYQVIYKLKYKKS